MSDYYILINLKNHIEIFFFLPHISVLFAYLRKEAKKSVNQTNKKTQVKQFWEFYYLSIFIIIGK